MIQRILYTALYNGVQAMVTNPSLFDDLFGELYGLPPTELAGIRKYFTTKTIKICHNYPHRDMVVPVYGIVLAGEQQSDRFLSDDVGAETMGSDANCDQSGAIWTHDYQILCYADHPDVTTYMYEIAKSVMQASDDFFLQNDVLEWNFGGMDLMPDTRYIPEHLFCRAMSVSCKRQFTRVDRKSRLGKAFKVTGIAAPSGSPNSNGGALTLATPYQPDPIGVFEGNDG